MTAIATPTNQAVSEWVKIFPRQATENYTGSVTFMKQLTVVAVSAITYLRNVFPEDSYMVESFNGIKLRILKTKCRDELAQFLSTALVQAFEAFDKKYLHQLALCFYEDECKIENLIEYYVFEYTYHDDGATMNVHSKNRHNVKHSMKYTFENVRDKTFQLIKTFVVMLDMCENGLPPSYDVSIRLYYNEDAPADYQAPGYFQTNETDHLEPTMSKTMKFGWVETSYHKLIARSYIKYLMEASHEAIPSQNPPVLSNEMDLSGSGVRTEIRPQLRCPCNKYDDHETYGSGALLTCDYCNTQQHAVCYGVCREDVARLSRHCCVICHDADKTRTPTDRKLVPLSERRREPYCVFRRTLEWCTELTTIELRNLTERFHMSEPNARKLIKQLYIQGIIRQDPDKINKPQKIITDQLKSTMAMYFNMKDRDIVDRLVSETFTSQENTPDPIGKVLSPLEKITLQNTSNIGRVIDNPNLNKVPNDNPTLKRYREALVSDNLEEPSTNPVETVRKAVKRKINNENRPASKTGVRTKRAKALPK